MASKLSINRRWVSADKCGRTCVVEVDVQQTTNKSLYPPDGVKSVFKVKREKTPGAEDFEVVILIDNHECRESIHVSNWQEAWHEFEKRIEGILNET